MKRKVFLMLALFALMAVGAYAQTYNPESDFEVAVHANGKSITITKYTGSATEVNIPPFIQNLPVTDIGNEAFRRSLKITSVTIPNSVFGIGDYAFRDCAALTSVTIADTVISIGREAFRNCQKLTSVTLGKSVGSIEQAAFQNCTSLTSITIPASVASIGNYAFDSCTSLTSVTFLGQISSGGFNLGAFSESMMGKIRDTFYSTDKTKGTPGTYTRPNGKSLVWTKQP